MAVVSKQDDQWMLRCTAASRSRDTIKTLGLDQIYSTVPPSFLLFSPVLLSPLFPSFFLPFSFLFLFFFYLLLPPSFFLLLPSSSFLLPLSSFLFPSPPPPLLLSSFLLSPSLPSSSLPFFFPSSSFSPSPKHRKIAQYCVAVPSRFVNSAPSAPARPRTPTPSLHPGARSSSASPW